jgi:hypothetical protein
MEIAFFIIVLVLQAPRDTWHKNKEEAPLLCGFKRLTIKMLVKAE